VTSTAFDPALEVVGPENKILASNDDIRPGEQDSLVLFAFPKPGNYKVLVKGYKSAGGGQYKITFRRFVPDEVILGKRAIGSINRTTSKWHKFTSEAGQIIVASVMSASFNPDLQIYAPSGEIIDGSPYEMDSPRAARTVFRAPAKGNYYARVSSGQGSPASYAIAVATASVRPLSIGAASSTRTIDDGGLDIWTVKGTAGELIQVDARRNGAPVKAILEFLPPLDKAAEETKSGATPQPVETLPSDPKSNGEVVALLKQTGSYQVVVWQLHGRATSYSLDSSHPAKTWP